MEGADIWLLKEIENWQFFGTLTRRSERWPQAVKACKRRAFFYKVCDRFHVRPERLLWCLREEPGEMTDRLHDHFILAGLPQSNVTQTTCFFLMHQWEHVIQGGHARVRVFNPELDGVGYMLKGLSVSAHQN